jgi:hypothetical protein
LAHVDTSKSYSKRDEKESYTPGAYPSSNQ